MNFGITTKYLQGWNQKGEALSFLVLVNININTLENIEDRLWVARRFPKEIFIEDNICYWNIGSTLTHGFNRPRKVLSTEWLWLVAKVEKQISPKQQVLYVECLEAEI